MDCMRRIVSIRLWHVEQASLVHTRPVAPASRLASFSAFELAIPNETRQAAPITGTTSQSGTFLLTADAIALVGSVLRREARLLFLVNHVLGFSATRYNQAVGAQGDDENECLENRFHVLH